MNPTDTPYECVAVIGMAGRFPRAKNLEEFWSNLRDGAESVSFFEEEELQGSLLDDPTLMDNPNFVKARAILEDADLFDAAFFGVNPKEAEIMDPQHRLFLECAWEALESAGYNPDTYGGLIGMFAGSSLNTYLLSNLLTNRKLIHLLGGFQTMVANDKDHLPTRVSYKLNLRGPSVNVQTASSTSLVAVCLACQNLLNYQCDMALAGGVSLTFPQKKGQLHEEGGIISPDGHCRAFDADAAGTVGREAPEGLRQPVREVIRGGRNGHGSQRGAELERDRSRRGRVGRGQHERAAPRGITLEVERPGRTPIRPVARRHEPPATFRSKSRKDADSHTAVESVNNAYLAAKSPWLQRQFRTPLGLGNLPFIVGRGPVAGEGRPPLPPDLKLDDTVPFRLSRNHFMIEKRDGNYYVRDLCSTLGTIVNGEPIGDHFRGDDAALRAGENEVIAGGVDSPFVFSVFIG